MGKFDQAPALIHDKSKMVEGTHKGKAIRTHELEYRINQELTSMAARAVMLFYTGNAGDGSFRISEKTICDFCNISASSYKAARKKLIDIGWISFTPYESIVVHFNKIFGEAAAEVPKKVEKIDKEKIEKKFEKEISEKFRTQTFEF